MNWIRNNTFLAAFLAVMVLGIGGLTYLLIDSMGRYDQVAQDYDTQVKELKRLQVLKPFPDQANLTTYQEVKKTYKQSVDNLRTNLATFEPAPETPPPGPTQFQDRLRRVVDDVTKAAQQANVAYPDDFYLGFERYRNSLPEAGATPLLSRQLDNIQELVGILIKERVERITAVKRAVLPQENGAGAAPALNPVQGQNNRPSATAAAELVAKLPVVLEFTGPSGCARATLNDISHSKRLFVVRALQVKNESDKGPVRGQDPAQGGGAGGAAVDSNAPASDPTAPKGAPALRYVVGQEKLNVVERVELVRVSP